MKIAVDARPLAHPLSGLGRYTESVLRELIPKGGSWYLYSDQKLLADFEGLGDVTVRIRESKLGPGALWAQWAFTRWAKKDNVNAFWSPRHHLPVFLSGKIKKLVTIHDLVWLRHPATMKKLGWLLELLLMPVSLYLADRIITVSQFTADELASVFRISGDKVSTIPLAPFPKGDNRVSQDVSKSADEYFLFVGTNEPRKNLRRMLLAFKIFLEEGSSKYRFYIVGGSGWGKDPAIDLIAEMGIEDSVVVLGHVNDSELEELYLNAIALVMPSLYEGFGLPILEAMDHGIPVITSNCASMPEVAGDSALMVNPESVVEIKQAMHRISTDAVLRAALVTKARDHLDSFSWQSTGDATLAALEQITHQQLNADG